MPRPALRVPRAAAGSAVREARSRAQRTGRSRSHRARPLSGASRCPRGRGPRSPRPRSPPRRAPPRECSPTSGGALRWREPLAAERQRQHREAQAGDRRVLERLEEVERLGLRRGDDVRHVRDGRGGHARRGQPLVPLGGRALAQPLGQDRDELLAVRHAVGVRAEARRRRRAPGGRARRRSPRRAGRCRPRPSARRRASEAPGTARPSGRSSPGRCGTVPSAR